MNWKVIRGPQHAQKSIPGGLRLKCKIFETLKKYIGEYFMPSGESQAF